MIDGELVLIGLAKLDEHFRRNLSESGILGDLSDGVRLEVIVSGDWSSSEATLVEPSSVRTSRLIQGVSPIADLSMSPDGEFLALVEDDRVIWTHVGSPPDYSETTTLETPLRSVISFERYSLLVIAANGESWLGGVPDSLAPLHQTLGHVSCATRVGSRGAAAVGDNTVWHFSVEAGGWVILGRGGARSHAIAASAGGSVVITGHDDGRLFFWYPARSSNPSGSSDEDRLLWEELGYLQTSSGAVSDLDVSWDRRVVSLQGFWLSVWLPSLGKPLFELHLEDEWPTVARFDPAGELIAVGGNDGGVRIVAARAGDKRTLSTRHSGAVLALAWAPNGRILYSAGEDGMVLAHELGVELGPDAHVDWMDDEPARQDALKRRLLASFIATQLRNFATKHPARSFLVHLDGPWGAGKSTLLDYLEDEFHEDADDPWLVTRFDAWRQSKVGPPWLALTAAIRKALRNDRPWPKRLGLRLQEWARLAGAGQWASTVVFALIVIAAVTYLIVGPGWSGLQGVQGVAAVLVGTIGVVGAIWSALKGATGVMFKSSSRRARDFEESQRDPMDDVACHFGWLLSKARKTIVLFVDDLDRCGDKYVVELLDTVQTLMRSAPRLASEQAGSDRPGLIFIVAADGRWIRKSYEEAHKTFIDSVSEPGRPLGYLFLEKLFQLTVPLPLLNPGLQEDFLAGVLAVEQTTVPDRASYLDGVLTDQIEASRTEHEILGVLNEAPPEQRLKLAEAAVKALNSPRLQKNTEHALQKFAGLLEPNPRSMKRFVLAYSIARGVRTVEGSAIDVDSLALWTALRSRWPALADYLARRPEMIGHVGESIDDLTKLGAPAEVASLLADPDGRLARLVGFLPHRPLTKDVVMECCGLATAEQKEPAAAIPEAPGPS